MEGISGWERGIGIAFGVAPEARGAVRVRGTGSTALCQKFRDRQLSGLGARLRSAGLVGRGRGS